ncbi:multiple epidermal growth factor-like domains protein 11 [Lingula anatina]|uniref:Multiple epidermal growth factor-like domains protein 11 n=1 Tax=Lingula anatina TaxID=7574 RepID=A0A1S3HQG9_LINAN|nr:multiple epidermal growth factor-like domains protein 11 [Lingula anatina]|eukprot:XP_013387786.1 multiple epidermal growth factor-like domains protein 11 [Lingula anatina]
MYCDPHELGNVTGVVTPVMCPAGYFCPNNTQYATQNPCAPGSFSNNTGLAAQADCSDCTPGMYCGTAGLTEPTAQCQAGYFCNGRASTATPTDGATGDICPQGLYCPQGSSVGVNCPIGRYGNQTGLTTSTECTLCDPGWYCPTPGLTASWGECTAGHYCELGATAASPRNETWGYLCPVGHYCPQGIPTPTPCPQGTYQPSADGKANVTDCLACDAGYYCQVSGSENVTNQCSPGYYCQGGANVSTPTDGVTGDICPAGHYCPLGSGSPTPCSNATYMNHTGASECYPCPAGHYCVNRDRADPCPQGFYCPASTGADIQPCPVGTYGATIMLANETDCNPCTGGFYCATPGLPAPTAACDAGFYCTSGVNISAPQDGVPYTGQGGLCPMGSDCPGGSAYPTICRVGTYTNQTGTAACDTCPEGFFCVNETINPEMCPAGHYCPAGTEFDVQYPCPAGTFNNDTGASNLTNCVQCSPGWYCHGTGNVVPTGQCDPGFYCPGGSYQQRPFDSGVLVNVSGSLQSLFSNDTCTPTWDCVCPSFLMTTGGVCPIGYYCPQGSANPLPCDGGKYCESPGLAEPTGEILTTS